MINGIIDINLKLDELSTQYAVYNLRESVTPRLVYIGHCPLVQLFSISDAARIPLFDRHAYYLLSVMDIVTGKVDAIKTTHERLKANIEVPLLNRHSGLGRHKKVICRETGEVFENAAHCARVEAIDPGTLNRHLNNKPGHKSVKQRTYMFAIEGEK
jgi:hypothetical protein